jgi:ATP-dependent protease Clp ATPase subunit
MALDFRCDFCGRARDAVIKLISGPRVFVCDACVLTFVELATDGAATPREPPVTIELAESGRAATSTASCSFCGKLPRETRFRFEQEHEHGGRRVICDECVSLCIDILAESLGGAWDGRVDTWPEAKPRFR